MAQITVEVNGKPYVVAVRLSHGCQPLVREVATNVGPLGETRLLLMGALLLADDLEDAKTRLARAQADLTRVQSDYARAEARAAMALDSAARRIEALATE